MDAHNFQPLHGCIPTTKNPLDGKFSSIPCPLVSTAHLKQYLHFLNDVRNRQVSVLVLFNLYKACVFFDESVMESFQSSNRMVPDSTRSSIGEPKPISRNAPEYL
ncbi:hypothetical protein M9H77_35910 [Catharanthus roseus]|uniref:Uncharacterized protein n=1 Tax=Catharanthus roseus TaxID=4058 RepID=A0ACB9ZR57_CATRO|nr:hypothetical protein M9H77_35910 [Catharanthus roseus]